jgi:hypothetical protein
MAINSIMITRIGTQYDAASVARELWHQGIAQVSSIALMPYIFQGEIFYIAYADISTWADSERAYDIIQTIRFTPATMIIDDDHSWQLNINYHNNGNTGFSQLAITFPAEFYVYPEDVEDDDNILEPIRLNFDGETDDANRAIVG